MRRPEVELSDAAARYVEQHPGVIEKLASGVPETKAGVTQAQRDRFRGYLREKLDYARSDEAAAAGEAWLAKHGLAGARLR